MSAAFCPMTSALPAAEARRLTIGTADRLDRSSHWRRDGASFHIAVAAIGECMRYVHAVDRHMLYVTLEGTTRYSAGRIGQEAWDRTPDRPGAVSFTPASWERISEVAGGTIRCAHIELDPAFVEDVAGCDMGSATWTAPFNAAEPKLRVMIDALAEEAGGEPDPLLMDSLLVAIARRAASRFGRIRLREDDAWLHPAAMQRVLARIRDQPAAPPSLDELAAEAGLGISAFIRAFRGAVGRTPGAYALDWRIACAAAALRGSDASLHDIAHRTGFASASHLVRTFKRRRGTTPAALRKALGQSADAAQIDASVPPSTTSAAPVTNDAPPDASPAIISATSRGSPSRFKP